MSVTEYSEVTLTTACRNEIIRSLTTDGNFTADHIKQKRDKDDVWLTNGEGMMTARARYHAHLAVAVETLDVCVHSKFIVLEINLVLSMIRRKVISGRSVKLTQPLNSRMLMALSSMLVLVMEPTALEAWLTFLRVRNKPVWTTHFVKLVRLSTSLDCSS